MISNTSVSKVASEGTFIDVQKYIGVAAVKVVAVNPDNKKLRQFGWNIPDDAEEPQYVRETMNEDGTKKIRARVRFLMQIQDFDDKPIIPIDFYISPEPWFNTDKTKLQVIDQYGRTCWVTKEQFKAQAIPQYSNGPAKISVPYKTSCKGQEDLVRFLMKYLCIAPFETFNRTTGKYEPNKNPGMLTIDNWKALCNGNASEIQQYVSLQPENVVKIILCIRNTDDNKSYQDFVTDVFIGNGAAPDNTGKYSSAEKIISKLVNDGRHSNYVYSSSVVSAYVIKPTDDDDVNDNDNNDDDTDDLPFD